MGLTGSCQRYDCGNSKAEPANGGCVQQATDTKPGRLVMRAYRMLTSDNAILGEGSFSVCHRGIFLETGKPVAIKVYITQHRAHNSENDEEHEIMMRKFTRQVDVLKRLQEPLVEPENPLLWNKQLDNAVPVDLLFQLIDFSHDEWGNPAADPDDGIVYVITEMAEYSLLAYLKDLKDRGKSLSLGAVKQIASSILLATAALHSKGLVHLDLKPENLMVFSNQIKVIDVDGCVPIGTVISVDDSSISFSLCYCAPEWAQFLLDDGKIVASPTLDAWSIGITLCELVTQRPVLQPVYASFMRHGHKQEEATCMFLDWLSNISKLNLPNSLTSFNTEFATFLTRDLLAPMPTLRRTPAECLSSPCFENKASGKISVEHDKLPITEPRARQNRQMDNSTEVVHKGTMWKLNSRGDPMDPAQWLQRDMWIASNGSLCYFSLKENSRLVLLDAQHICRSEISRVNDSARAHTFKVKAPSDDHEHGEANMLFSCDSDEDYEQWIEKLKTVKVEVFRTVHLGGKFTHDIRQHKLTVRNRRMSIGNPSCADFKPIVSGKLWKLKADGNRMHKDDWFERDMWITKNGCLAYWSKRDERSLLYYTVQDIERAKLRTVSDDESSRAHTFQVCLSSQGGIEFAPGEFACESDRLRTMWMQEFEKLGARTVFTDL